MTMLNNWTSFLGHWSVIVAVVAILVVALIISQALHWLLQALVRRATPARRPWRHAILAAVDAPARTVVWLIGITVALTVATVGKRWPIVHQLFPPTRDVLVILAITWFAVRLVDQGRDNLVARAQERGEALDPTVVDAISKLCWLAVFVTAGMVIMQTLGFSIAGLLAFGGAAGIAVGFAAQSLVANLLGGLTIYASRIFKIGEYIILPGTELMGGVEHIGWRATRVMGFDRKPFYIPNATFNTSTVINHSRMTARRISEYVHIRYEDVDRVSAIVADVNEYIGAHDDIEHDFYVFRFATYGDFSLNLFLYAYTVSTAYVDYMATKEDILLAIARIVREHDAEIALPSTSVRVPDGLQLAAPPDMFTTEQAQPPESGPRP